jgi:carboxylate-amine ligase
MATMTSERSTTSAPSAADLRASFERAGGFTVGLEEEVMVLDPRTLDLAPRAADLLARLPGDERFRPELPAAQLEILTAPAPHAVAAGGLLAAARADLRAAAGEDLRLAGSGTHPFAHPVGQMSDGERYELIVAEYGWAALRGLVFGLHVHVAVGGADRTLAVADALRSHLPEIAALAGNAPFLAGEDTGLASVRPKIAEAFPRQGVPPALGSWERYAELLAWGRRAGSVPDAGHLWWELRLHPEHGTIEVRAPDTPARAAHAAAIAALVQGLCAELAARFDAGEPLPVHDDVRIAENRWRALRHGLDGTLADLGTGEPEPTRERLARLLARVAPYAERLGSGPALAGARELLAQSGAERQRALAERHGVHGLVARLEREFCA